MKNNQLFDVALQLNQSVELIEAIDGLGLAKLLIMLGKLGYEEAELKEISKYIDENTNQEEFTEYVEHKAFATYIQALENAKKLMEMAKGYEEMGTINLTISQEDHHLEDEGAKAYEMDSKDTKGTGTQG